MKTSRQTFGLVVLMAAMLFIFSTARDARAQQIVDKTVAVVSDGVRTELITYSDLVWQLALQPGTQLDAPRSEDLNRALQLLINQRIFALEAERLPRPATSDKEIADKINDTLAVFTTPASFEARLKQVGFESVKDPAFERLIARRVAIEKYVDFRFASFVVVTPDEETKYYRDIYVPEFHRRNTGLLVPTIEEKRAEIRTLLTRQKVATAIETFLDEAKRRVEVEVLIEV